MDQDRQARWDALDQLKVAKNCPASWRHMQGDDRVRHCTHCNRNVYNLSNMSRDEAAEIVEKNEGRLCARFYRRHDGMIMTKDCGRAVRARVKLTAALGTVLSVIGLALLPPVYAGAAASPQSMARTYERQIRDLDAEIAKEKDPETKAALKELRKLSQEKLSNSIRLDLKS